LERLKIYFSKSLLSTPSKRTNSSCFAVIWGFKGAIITDCAGADNADYMNMDEALRVGGDLGS